MAGRIVLLNGKHLDRRNMWSRSFNRKIVWNKYLWYFFPSTMYYNCELFGYSILLLLSTQIFTWRRLCTWTTQLKCQINFRWEVPPRALFDISITTTDYLTWRALLVGAGACQSFCAKWKINSRSFGLLIDSLFKVCVRMCLLCIGDRNTWRSSNVCGGLHQTKSSHEN